MQKSSLLISMNCVADGQEDMLKAAPTVNVEIREHFPAASSSQDTYTLLKFYNLSKDLIKTLLQVHHAGLHAHHSCLSQAACSTQCHHSKVHTDVQAASSVADGVAEVT